MEKKRSIFPHSPLGPNSNKSFIFFSQKSLPCSIDLLTSYITKSDFGGFLVFFQDLCEFVRHGNKIHIFLCLFVIFLTITGRNEAIVVELQKNVVFKANFITFSEGSYL